jgi:hypothetical protein
MKGSFPKSCGVSVHKQSEGSPLRSLPANIFLAARNTFKVSPSGCERTVAAEQKVKKGTLGACPF